jgi:putative tricarboxylic transport membrane protein
MTGGCTRHREIVTSLSRFGGETAPLPNEPLFRKEMPPMTQLTPPVARVMTIAVAALLIFSACGPSGQTTSPGTPASATSPSPGGESAAPASPAETGLEGPSGTADLAIMAPADPGGGWDSTARAMQGALESGGIIGNVEVYNVGGAGGTIGLAQFVEDNSGKTDQLMVMGLVMVGAILTNNSPVTLEQVTPIASLTSEQEAIAVPADSQYETLEQLVEAWKADPRSISWGGGSSGGTDHILVGLMAKAAGIDPADINYVAHSGGGEALAAILSGAVSAGVSGVSEFADQVESGAMRWLAVSGDEAPEGVDAPTIKEAGLDVSLENWRGVVAPPELSDADRDGIVTMITTLHDSEAWQTALQDNGWGDFFQPGDDFASYLDTEQTRVEGVLKDVGLIQ